MSIEIASWNALNAFGDPTRNAQAVEHMLAMAPDVAVFSEAYDIAPGRLKCEQAVAYTRAAFEEAGYYFEHAPYDDPLHYGMEHGMIAVSRLPWDIRQVRIEQRNSLDLRVVEPETSEVIQVLGVHYDHLEASRRRQQAEETIDLRESVDSPFVVAGDMNSVHAAERQAKVLSSRIARAIANCVPGAYNRWLATALRGMAEGSALTCLKYADLRDADALRLATAPACLPLVQLDHIFVSDNLFVDSFTRHRYSRISDHRAISTMVTPTDIDDSGEHIELPVRAQLQ